MPDQRAMLALRTIAVSTQAALRHARPGDADAVVDRADALLADLEAQVIRDGADQTVLDAIGRERRAIQAERTYAEAHRLH